MNKSTWFTELFGAALYLTFVKGFFGNAVEISFCVQNNSIKLCQELMPFVSSFNDWIVSPEVLWHKVTQNTEI